MPPIRSLGSTTWGWSRCWQPSGASRLLHEPPDAEPHVRWCGRTARVTSPPTRSDYPGVVALRLPNLGLCGGADLGSDHLARHYQLDASILLTAFRGTI